jgi:predicted amidohydrolase
VLFKVAAGQFLPRIGDLEFNRGKILEQAHRAAGQNADLIVFPELCLTGYLLRDETFQCGLSADDSFLDPVKDISRKLSIAIGLVEKDSAHRYYNSAFYYEDGCLKHVHRKIYLPTYGIFEEKRFFAEGDRIRAFDSKFGRTGILVCNDLWHASAPWLLAMDGADLILVLAASPTRGVSAEEVSDNTRIWNLLLAHTAKSLSNFVIFANLCGYQDGIHFWGSSGIYGPNGRLLAQADLQTEGLITATLDTEILRRERVYSPLRRDERLLLTYHELQRIVQEKFR